MRWIGQTRSCAARSETAISDAPKSRATAASPAAEGDFSRPGGSKSPARYRSRALHAGWSKRVPVRPVQKLSSLTLRRAGLPLRSPAAEGDFSRPGGFKSPARIRSRALRVASSKRVPVRPVQKLSSLTLRRAGLPLRSAAAEGNFSRPGGFKSPAGFRSRALRVASSKRVPVRPVQKLSSLTLRRAGLPLRSPAAECDFSRPGRSKSPAGFRSRALRAGSGKRVPVRPVQKPPSPTLRRAGLPLRSPAAEGNFSRPGRSKSPARIRSRALHVASSKRVPVRPVQKLSSLTLRRAGLPQLARLLKVTSQDLEDPRARLDFAAGLFALDRANAFLCGPFRNCHLRRSEEPGYHTEPGC